MEFSIAVWNYPFICILFDQSLLGYNLQENRRLVTFPCFPMPRAERWNMVVAPLPCADRMNVVQDQGLSSVSTNRNLCEE